MAAPTVVGTSTASTGSNVSSQAVDYPVGSAAGDLLLMLVHTQKTSGGYDHTTPTDWTAAIASEAPGGSGGSQRMSLYWRIRGAETSVTPTWTATAAPNVAVIAIRGADPTNPIREVGSAQYDSGSGTSITCPGVTTTAPDSLLAAFACALRSSGTAYTHTWGSPAVEQTDLSQVGTVSSNRNGVSSATYGQASPGATGARTATASTSVVGRWGVQISIAPIIIVSSGDTAALSDSAATTRVAAADQLALTDSATRTAAISASDAATVTDSASTTLRPDPDQLALADAATRTGTTSSSDQLTATDTAVRSAIVPGEDGLALTDTAVMATVITAADTLTVDDDGEPARTRKPGVDELALAETAAVTTTAASTDSVALTDTAVATDIRTSTDTLSLGDDTAATTRADGDALALTDSAAVIGVAVTADSLTLVEAARITHRAAGDQLTLTDQARTVVSGRPLTGARVLRVPAANRAIHVPPRDRITTVPARHPIAAGA